MKTLDDALNVAGAIRPDTYNIGSGTVWVEARDAVATLGGHGFTPAILRRIADHLDPQADSSPVIPEGWVLVPKELTWAMEYAEFEEQEVSDGGCSTQQLWDTLLAAAPKPPLRTESAVRAEARQGALEEAAQVSDRFAAQTRDDFEGAAAKDIGAGIRSLIGGAV